MSPITIELKTLNYKEMCRSLEFKRMKQTQKESVKAKYTYNGLCFLKPQSETKIYKLIEQDVQVPTINM